jgi:hypothetical protein
MAKSRNVEGNLSIRNRAAFRFALMSVGMKNTH